MGAKSEREEGKGWMEVICWANKYTMKFAMNNKNAKC